MNLMTSASPVALMLRGGMPLPAPVPMSVGTPLDVTTGHDLTARAFNIAREKYTADGKRLSKMHERALFYIAARLTNMVTGHAQKQLGANTLRLAYGLQCGGGKTLSALSWIAAIHHLHQPYSVALAANEIEALCGLKRDLINDFGVPEDRIGLLHTLGNKASEPATPRDQIQTKQFLLVSHNMIRTGDRNLALFNTYQDQPRNLVIYDESLIVSDSWSIKNKNVRAGLDWLDREINYEPFREELVPIKKYVEDTLALLLAEADRQGSLSNPRPVTIPELTEYAEDLHPDAAKLLLPKDAPGYLRTILDVTGRDVRVVAEGSRGVAWFEAKVPEELHNVFVLDASHLIRDLPKLNSNMRADSAAVDPGITFPDMSIEYFKTPAGYGSIVTECNKPWQQRKLLKKLATWIKALPEGEKVNVWTFKQRNRREDPDIPSVLEAGLARHKVDLDRITILTHGKAKGSNQYADAPHTAFYGVFEQDKLNFAGQMLGQSDDLLTDLEDLQQVHKSEILHDAFQEIARSGVRLIDDGRGGRGSVLFPCWHTDVAERLVSPHTFQGATLIHREDLEDQPKASAEPAKYGLVAESIIATLEDLDPEMTKIRSMDLKPMVAERVGFRITEDVWKAAINEVAKGGPPLRTQVGPTPDSSWKRTPRGFARLAAKDYGF